MREGSRPAGRLPAAGGGDGSGIALRLLIARSPAALVLAALPLLVAAGPAPRVGPLPTRPLVSALSVDDAATPFDGDGPLLATVDTGANSSRTAAVVRFALTRPAAVDVGVYSARRTLLARLWGTSGSYGAGAHEVVWRPAPASPDEAYVVRLVARSGPVVEAFGRTSSTSRERPGPVVHVLAVEAAFDARSYAPGALARLRVAADVQTLTLQLFRVGYARVVQFAEGIPGAPVAPPVTLDWSGHRDAPAAVRLRIGAWPSGLYFARLAADDGQVGFAPFVVTTAAPGPSRVAVVLPTNTWQAYNFRDENGDGYGDTWYAGGVDTIDLARAYVDGGQPPFFSGYDLGFERWLARHRLAPDFLSDDDLERFPDAAAIRRAYDLVVFPGHEEYVTEHVFALVRGFRDLGGNLIFLSADNLYWRVVRHGDLLTRTASFRQLGRPEDAVIGVQYRAHENALGCYMITGAGLEPWLFAGSGLVDGSSLCSFGIEIDAATADSPPGLEVLARIPDLFGPGRSAEMTYYPAMSGAQVFAAGTINLGGDALLPPVDAMLTNLWSRFAPAKQVLGAG